MERLRSQAAHGSSCLLVDVGRGGDDAMVALHHRLDQWTTEMHQRRRIGAEEQDGLAHAFGLFRPAKLMLGVMPK